MKQKALILCWGLLCGAFWQGYAQNGGSVQQFWQRYKAQPAEELATDRPDQTECSSTIPAGTFQLETGVLYEHSLADGASQNILTYPTSLLRIGILKNLELRVINDFAFTRLFHNPPNQREETYNGLNTLAVGAKVYLCKEKGLRPEISLNAHIHLPVGLAKYRPKWSFPDFRFLCSHTLSQRFSLSYNLGYSFNSGAEPSQFEYTLALGADLGKGFGCYVESYGGVAETGDGAVNFDGGFTFLLLPLVQLDCSAGFDALNFSGQYWFLSSGLSFRLPK